MLPTLSTLACKRVFDTEFCSANHCNNANIAASPNYSISDNDQNGTFPQYLSTFDIRIEADDNLLSHRPGQVECSGCRKYRQTCQTAFMVKDMV